MKATWTERGLRELRWEKSSHVDEKGLTGHDVPNQALLLETRLTEFFESGRSSFSEVVLDEEGWTEFTLRVYRQCRKIEPGQTLTYKQLAELAGSPNASRAVGAAMSRNRVLLVIPCHRVLSSNGQLTGFSAPGGLQTKRYLLDLES